MCYQLHGHPVTTSLYKGCYDNLVDRLTDWLQVVRFVRVNICKYVKIDKKEKEKEKEMRAVEKCDSFTVKKYQS